MNRKEKALHYLDPSGFGIEIGPSYGPMAPKKEGYNVHIIDYLNREQLIAKYKAWDVSPESLENIEDVDFIWRGGSYSELTGKSKYYDWIIASHMIEHTPDLIGFLKDCDSILNENGVISLVIPDKRYCFDHYRPITGISKIIDSHILKNHLPTAGAVAEFYLNRVSKSGNIAWDTNTLGEYRLLHSLEEAYREMIGVISEKKYVDTHMWCFVPHSFRLIIQDLFDLGFIPFRELGFFPTEGCEFHIALGRNGKGIDTPRLEILETIELELNEKSSTSESVRHQNSKRKNVFKRLFHL